MNTWSKESLRSPHEKLTWKIKLIPNAFGSGTFIGNIEKQMRLAMAAGPTGPWPTREASRWYEPCELRRNYREKKRKEIRREEGREKKRKPYRHTHRPDRWQPGCVTLEGVWFAPGDTLGGFSPSKGHNTSLRGVSLCLVTPQLLAGG